MTKKYISIVALVVTMLVLTDIVTIVYYNYKVQAMRKQSSFINAAGSFVDSKKKCLDRNGIENKISNGVLQIREVDSYDAIASCS